MSRTMKESVQAFAVKQVLNYLDEGPESLPKVLDWAEKFDKNGRNAHLLKPFHAILDDPNNNWNQLIKSLWTDIDPAVRKVVFENFVVNTALIGSPRQDKAKEEHNCNIPCQCCFRSKHKRLPEKMIHDIIKITILLLCTQTAAYTANSSITPKNNLNFFKKSIIF